jgi:FkbM family methyltransferase
MLRYLRDMAEAAYVAALARPNARRINNAVLRMAVRARGYGNGGSVRQTGEAAFIARLAAGGEVGLCLDVGANTGEYSRAVLELTQGTVVAFEPQPAPFSALSELQRAYPGRFTAVNLGVADGSGTRELQWGSNSLLASFSDEVRQIPYVRDSNVNRTSVAVTTIDDFLSGAGRRFGELELTLVKIDTEGYEFEVLKGAERTLRERRPKFVQIEFNHHQLFRGHTLYSLSKLLRGYTVHQILPGNRGLSPVAPDDPCANFFDYANFVFAREDARL